MNTPKNIEELLERLNKQTPFKVPEGYFEELEDRVMSKVKADEVELDTKLPFEVPLGYFDGLADKVMDQVGKKPAKRLNVWRKPMAVAASVAALLMLSFGIYYMRLPQKGETAEITFDGVSTDELYAVIQEEVSMDLIAEVLQENNTTILQQELEDTTKVKQQDKEVEDKLEVIPTDDLEEYLLEDLDDLFIDEI